jgi:LysM repeat protein
MPKLHLYLLVLCFFTSLTAYSQKHNIKYFSSDSSHFIIPDLYANLNDSVYTLIDNAELNCLSIEMIKDYNGDGKTDLLMGEIHGCGGNCCANSYFFFSYNNGSFHRTKSVGNGHYLKSELWKNKWSIIIHSNVQDSSSGHRRWIKQRYVLKRDSIFFVEEYHSAKINSSEGDYIMQWDTSYFRTTAFFIHTVKKNGQSLWALANKYKTSVNSLIKLNNLRNNTIYLGDKLKIPKKNKQLFHLHKISKKESLWSLSQEYKVPISIIKKANNMENNAIQLGEFIKIPRL